jgi:guanylate cyclase
MKKFFQDIFRRLAAIGVDPADDAETHLPKSTLVLSTIPFMLAGVAWGYMYISFGEMYAGLIPLCYGIFSFFSLIYYGLSRNFQFYRFSQLLLILLLPFFLMMSLGGFITGSAVILWGLISPLGAMLFDERGRAPRWLFAYLGTIVLSIIVTPLFDVPSNLTNQQIQMFFVINLCGVGMLVYMMFYYFVRQKQFFQQRTEELLLNILPRETATELKETGTTTAKAFEEVTVLFTDFENFTRISEKMNAQDLVNEIHYCYSAFDTIITRYGLEKIKTIGDSYMCAAGIPVKKGTHAIDAVSAALEICAFIEQEKQRRLVSGLPFFEIRIGLNSGPVVAGIVGIKKFAYDIWGDTVNIASRLESSGQTGRVNIGGSTYELVKDQFACTYRGKIEAKNKGGIDMYFVEGIK